MHKVYFILGLLLQEILREKKKIPVVQRKNQSYYNQKFLESKKMGNCATLRGAGPFRNTLKGELGFDVAPKEGTRVMALIASCQTSRLSRELEDSLGVDALHGGYRCLSNEEMRAQLPALKAMHNDEDSRLEYFDYEGLEKAVEAGWEFFYSYDG